MSYIRSDSNLNHSATPGALLSISDFRRLARHRGVHFWPHLELLPELPRLSADPPVFGAVQGHISASILVTFTRLLVKRWVKVQR